MTSPARFPSVEDPEIKALRTELQLLSPKNVSYSSQTKLHLDSFSDVFQYSCKDVEMDRDTLYTSSMDVCEKALSQFRKKVAAEKRSCFLSRELQKTLHELERKEDEICNHFASSKMLLYIMLYTMASL